MFQVLLQRGSKEVGHYKMQDKVKSLTMEESWIILETDIYKARKLSSELVMTQAVLTRVLNPSVYNITQTHVHKEDLEMTQAVFQTVSNPSVHNSTTTKTVVHKEVNIPAKTVSTVISLPESALNSTNTQTSVHKEVNTPRTVSTTNSVPESVHSTNSDSILLHNSPTSPSIPSTSKPQLDQRTTLFNLPNPRYDCPAMLAGDNNAIREAKYYMYVNKRKPLSGFDYRSMARNCEAFTKTRGYIMEPLSEEESEFPIAFSILMHSSIEQAERLLRAIYQPQNYYCIHIDSKTDSPITSAMEAITNCFPNVFITSQSETVYWGHISIIHAEMHCMKELMQYKWKYFINLSGQMFPLHSNRELVKILKLYDGANDIEGTYKRYVLSL